MKCRLFDLESKRKSLLSGAHQILSSEFRVYYGIGYWLHALKCRPQRHVVAENGMQDVRDEMNAIKRNGKRTCYTCACSD